MSASWRIPIPYPVKEQETKISELVALIINKKEQSPKADTTAIETQIDQLVYQLYGLTEEEIKIVEEAVK